MIESSIPTDYSGGGKFWEDNKKAENINNLPQGYYHQMLGGKILIGSNMLVDLMDLLRRVNQYGRNMMIHLWLMKH